VPKEAEEKAGGISAACSDAAQMGRGGLRFSRKGGHGRGEKGLVFARLFCLPRFSSFLEC
jgi:hypothetical protein